MKTIDKLACKKNPDRFPFDLPSAVTGYAYSLSTFAYGVQVPELGSGEYKAGWKQPIF